MSDATRVLQRILIAASRQDRDAVRGLIDWPLTGAPAMAKALYGVLEADRARVAATGLAELAASANRPELTDGILNEIWPILAGALEARTASEPERADAIGALQLPPPAPGLVEEQREQLDALRGRAAMMREVYVIVADAGVLPVALTAETRRLVLVLPPV
jgi:hypothetical protein